jgi:hypothetical protein
MQPIRPQRTSYARTRLARGAPSAAHRLAVSKAMPASSVALYGRVCRVGSACAVSSWSAACDCLAAGAPGRTACCPRPARLLAEAGGRRSAVRQAATPQRLRRDAAADANGQIPVLSGSGPKGRSPKYAPWGYLSVTGWQSLTLLTGPAPAPAPQRAGPGSVGPRPARGRCSAMPRRHCQLHGGLYPHRYSREPASPGQAAVPGAGAPDRARCPPLGPDLSVGPESPATRASASGPAARPIRVAAQPRARRRGAPAPTVKRH